MNKPKRNLRGIFSLLRGFSEKEAYKSVKKRFAEKAEVKGYSRISDIRAEILMSKFIKKKESINSGCWLCLWWYIIHTR